MISLRDFINFILLRDDDPISVALAVTGWIATAVLVALWYTS